MDYDSIRLFLKYFSRALMLLLVLPLTNCTKGLVARWQGDDTADREGRITLNPVAHLDLLGSLAIMLCGFGWSKPLPINFTRMKSYRKGVILISLTGPVTHFLSAIILMNVNSLLYYTASSIMPPVVLYCIGFVISTLAEINICLGVISILPLPPLDGFVLLHQFAGAKFNRWYYTNMVMINQISTLILLFLFFVGRLTDGHFDPLMWLVVFVERLISFTTIWIPAIFG